MSEEIQMGKQYQAPSLRKWRPELWIKGRKSSALTDGGGVKGQAGLRGRKERKGLWFILTCGLDQLRVEAVGDERFREIGEESFQRSGGGVDGHVHHHEVDAVVCKQSTV